MFTLLPSSTVLDPTIVKAGPVVMECTFISLVLQTVLVIMLCTGDVTSTGIGARNAPNDPKES